MTARVTGHPRRDRITAHLVEHVAGLDHDVAAATVDRVAAGRGLAELDRHLQTDPHALDIAASLVPRSLIRLAHALHDAGYTSIALPVCAECHKPTRDHHLGDGCAKAA